MKKTPYEAWHGQKTQVHKLKEFGCHIPIQEKEKFEEKVNLCWLDQRIQIHVLNTLCPIIDVSPKSFLLNCTSGYFQRKCQGSNLLHHYCNNHFFFFL